MISTSHHGRVDKEDVRKEDLIVGECQNGHARLNDPSMPQNHNKRHQKLCRALANKRFCTLW